MLEEEELRRITDFFAEILAVLLAEKEMVGYVDKVSKAPSRELLLFHLNEACRDFFSLKRGREFKPKTKELIKRMEEKMKNKNYIELIENYLNSLYQHLIKGDRKKLREVSSLIGAKAILLASVLREEGHAEGGEDYGGEER